MTEPEWWELDDVRVGELRRRFDGSTSSELFDSIPDEIDAVWGSGKPDGCALGVRHQGGMIFGPEGTFKTTMGATLAAGFMGIVDHVAGAPIQRMDAGVLYLASDRPKSIARRLRDTLRGLHAFDEEIDRYLTVWEGPTLEDIAKHPLELASLMKASGRELVIVDSLKDVTADLSKEETGHGVNKAVRAVLMNGGTLWLLHHQPSDVEQTKPYGSVWAYNGLETRLRLERVDGTQDRVILHHVKASTNFAAPLEMVRTEDGVMAPYLAKEQGRLTDKAVAQQPARKRTRWKPVAGTAEDRRRKQVKAHERPELHEGIVRELRAGTSRTDMAKALGCTTRTIQQAINVFRLEAKAR